MSFWERLFNWRSNNVEKQGGSSVFFGTSAVSWMDRDPRKFADEGYRRNAIVFKCIREIAIGASEVDWVLTRNDTEIDRHPLLDLMARPNFQEGRRRFMLRSMAHYLLSGNTYIEASSLAPLGRPAEIFVRRPDKMRVETRNGFPARYRYAASGSEREIVWDVDERGRSDILHIKDFHPLDNVYGMSPMDPSAYSVDQSNMAAQHNMRLLQNVGRPPAVATLLPVKGPGGEEIVPTQSDIDRFEALLEQKYTGPEGRRKTMVTGGNVQWTELGFSLQDLEWLKGKEHVAREICLAYGVPPVLLLPGESTFNNRADARLELWEQTIIPLLNLWMTEFNHWLVPRFGDGLSMHPDLDNVSALLPRRTLRWNLINGATFLTDDEKREELGFEPLGGDAGQLSAGGAPSRKQTKSTPDVSSILMQLDLPGNLDKMHMTLAPGIKRLTENAMKGWTAQLGISFNIPLEESAKQFSEQVTGQLIQTRSHTKDVLRRTLTEGVQAQESTRKLMSRVRQSSAFSKGRAFRIAITESTRVAGYASNETMKEAEIEEKEWLATPDDHVRDSHWAMNEQKVNVDDEFEDPLTGARAEYPGGFGIAELDIHCRCVSVPAEDNPSKSKSLTWLEHETKRQNTEHELQALAEDFLALQLDIVLEAMEDGN